ncbi:MAG: Crp/Fnr family transcriptional regulator [Gammaproteobacteria bacterium]|jgi:CRP-like cAMP-binding protein
MNTKGARSSLVPDATAASETLHAFSDTLDLFSGFTEEQIEKVVPLSRVRTIRKQGCFIREGQQPRSFAFVRSGLFRYFYSDSNGHEFTKGFLQENSFIASYSALIQKRASYFSIQALEESLILEIDYEKWKSLAEKDLCWQKFLLGMLEKGYCIKEAREREFLLLDAEQRYRSFLSTFPTLEKRVKQHVIASYLGITPVALSRLRRNIRSINTG